MTRVIPDERRCHATSRQTGERCGQWAINGGRVCRYHGGSLKRTKTAAQRRLAVASAAKSLAQMGVEPVDDPQAAVLGLFEEQLALGRYLLAYAAQMQEDPAAADPAELRARVEAASRQQERTARLGVDIVKLGLAEQRLALDAQRVQIVAELLDRVVTALGHDPADSGVRLVIGREIRALPQVVEGEVVDRG